MTASHSSLCPYEQKMRTEQIKIRGDYIRLCDLLKFCAVCSTGGEAKNNIENNRVLVNGAVCLVKGKKIRVGDTVVLGDHTIEVVGGAN